jgi:1A family penicillin-binding protein
MKSKKILLFLKILSYFFLTLFIGIIFIFWWYTRNFPRPELFFERQVLQSTKIYDKSGKILLYEVFGEERRSLVPLSEIPDYLKFAVIITEDKNFYSHFGIDIKGILRALLKNLKLKKLVFGGSTITQQLVRSTFLSTEKTWERKIKEIVLAIELERKYSKNQILEWYLNQVPFGQNAYGVGAASEVYFGKKPKDLSLAESATLAALIKAPYRLSPFNEEGKKELIQRRNYILDEMVRAGYIGKEEAEKAKNEELVLKERKGKLVAPYFTLYVLSLLEEKYGRKFLEGAGWKVYTTLDWDLQQIAEEVVKKGIERNKKYNAYNGALVALSSKGEILAMTVGNGDYNAPPYPEGCIPGKNCLFDPKFNVVIGGENYPGRQPGSAFKPFAYVTAFQKGWSDKTVVIDEPTNFGIWGGKPYEPQNYDLKFRGPVTLREALAQSLNVPSVKVLLYLAGLEDTVKTAQMCGITTLKPPFGPAIVLGGWEVKLIELTSAYGVFAADGVRYPYFAISKIEDSKGNIIYETKPEGVRVLDKNAVRLLNDVLSDNIARAPMFGLNSPLYFENYQVAVKTGTTQDYRDAWTIGYTPSIIVGVWVGNNNNEPISKQPGAMVAAPIFHEFLEKVLPRFPKENFPKPEF